MKTKKTSATKKLRKSLTKQFGITESADILKAPRFCEVMDEYNREEVIKAHFPRTISSVVSTESGKKHSEN